MDSFARLRVAVPLLFLLLALGAADRAGAHSQTFHCTAQPDLGPAELFATAARRPPASSQLHLSSSVCNETVGASPPLMKLPTASNTSSRPQSPPQLLDDAPPSPSPPPPLSPSPLFLSSSLTLGGYSAHTFGTYQAFLFCASMVAATDASSCTVTAVTPSPSPSSPSSHAHTETNAITVEFTLQTTAPRLPTLTSRLLASPSVAAFAAAGLDAVTSAALSATQQPTISALPPLAATSLPVSTAAAAGGAGGERGGGAAMRRAEEDDGKDPNPCRLVAALLAIHLYAYAYL